MTSGSHLELTIERSFDMTTSCVLNNGVREGVQYSKRRVLLASDKDFFVERVTQWSGGNRMIGENALI
ncbi:hypothetical protein L596_009404 [Steinernema carpocapsae]|uniref:Uncharacterized protein n=1 Tax=Steinernema carpocapsae TaxID=34508 RepID=A0A4U5PFR2_STECR|nr:hypothetical protein L596_009404 [Steinernema carpocapsae]